MNEMLILLKTLINFIMVKDEDIKKSLMVVHDVLKRESNSMINSITQLENMLSEWQIRADDNFHRANRSDENAYKLKKELDEKNAELENKNNYISIKESYISYLEKGVIKKYNKEGDENI